MTFFRILPLLMLLYQLYSIRVLQLQDNVSSNDNVTVELENSSIDKLKEFTLCGRFLTPYLPHMQSNVQSLLYRSGMYLMGRIELRNCEDRFPGCTKLYQDDLGMLLLLSPSQVRNLSSYPNKIDGCCYSLIQNLKAIFPSVLLDPT